jgi:hypothetical protein
MTDEQSILISEHDYSRSGLTIQQALLDAVRTNPGRRPKPPAIRWGDRVVQTSACIDVPKSGRFAIEFLGTARGAKQGVDLKVDGAIRLADGQEVTVLRSWQDDRYEDRVEYDFTSKDAKLWVWNIYEVCSPAGVVEPQKWTENAGFWVEKVDSAEWVYHCSSGFGPLPDFESLVFRLAVLSRPTGSRGSGLNLNP